MNLYRALARPALDVISFFDKERAHYAAIFALRLCGARPMYNIVRNFFFIRNERKVFGILFPNPVGAAAGFDKRGVALRGLEALGFGFVEVGTVTPLPQPGNPKPRLFRLDEDRAVINRMGFNSEGAEVLAERLAAYTSRRIPIGINIGKNKDTPLERATEDYEKGIEALYPYADYFTLNISSPNTKDLRKLHDKEPLEALLSRVKEKVRSCAAGEAPKPVLLKISPDLSTEELDSVLEIAVKYVQGLVVCNTTTARPEHLRSPYKGEVGGLSGEPLRERALELVRYVHGKLPSMPIIGVGGISSPEDAQRMFEAGALLVQLYSSLVFEGPLLVSRINRALRGH